jgi:hypothetical protein
MVQQTIGGVQVMAKRKVVRVSLDFEYYPDENEPWATIAKVLDEDGFLTGEKWKEVQEMMAHYKDKCADEIQSLVKNGKLHDALQVEAE